jgi:glycosyltransferase involved in cell wall biosynthesis
MEISGARGSAAPGPHPRFSVVIPARNEADLIGACLESLAAQDVTERVQIVVVDNDSSDETAAVARAHGAEVVAEPRHGVCFARQCGLDVATGEIIVSTDADTTFGPGWLSSIDAAFRADGAAVAVAGPCVYVDGPGWSLTWSRLLFSAVALVARVTGKVGYVSATNLAFRSDAFTGYDTRLTQGGDELDVLRRLQRRGRVVFRRDQPTYTSARRLRHGLLYSLVVSLGYYYLLGYVVNRVARRPLLGTAPNVRPGGAGPTALLPARRTVAGAAALAVVVVGILWYTGFP